MTVGTSLRSGLRVLLDRPASVLPVYLLVIGITAMTRVPILLGLAAVIGLLVADGRLDALITELEAFDPATIDNSSPEAVADSIPPGLEQAAVDLVSLDILALFGGAVILAMIVSIVANSLGNAAAINGIYGALYGGDGVRDAVVGLGRDWKPFLGITLVKLGVVIVGLVPVAFGASLFALSRTAGIAATLVGLLLSTGFILIGLLLLTFAGQSIVVDGAGFGDAIRRSAGFPFGQPTQFVAYILVALGVFGALSVLGGLFGALGVSQLSGIIGPLLAVPFVDAFKTALYADRPFVSASGSDRRSTAADTAVTDGGDPTDEDHTSTTTVDQPPVDSDDSIRSGDSETESSAETVAPPAASDSSAGSRPAYRHRFVGAFRDGLAALAGFTRSQPVPILAAAVLFSLAIVGGWQLTAEYAVDLPATEDVGNVFGTFPVAAFVMIAANNWLVSATAIFGGVALGIPTALDMLLNGFIVGAVYGIADPLVFAALVVPHGIIELPAIIVAGGLGFHLAVVAAGVFRGTRTSTDLAEALRLAYRVLLGLAVVLVIASFIEAFLTPAIAEFVLA